MGRPLNDSGVPERNMFRFATPKRRRLPLHCAQVGPARCPGQALTKWLRRLPWQAMSGWVILVGATKGLFVRRPPLALLVLALIASGCSNERSGDEETDPPPVVSEEDTDQETKVTASVTTSTTMPATTTTAPATTQPSTAAAWPEKRAYHEMVYDSGSDVVLMMGGVGPDIVPSFAVWSFDPATMSWTELGSMPADLDPVGAPAAYDVESDRVIYLQTTAFDFETDPVSTWAFDTDTNTWTEMTPDPHPRLGFGARMAYDSESDRIIAYGGMTMTGPDLLVTPGTWAYDYNTNTWEKRTPEGEPPGVNYHGMAYDPGSDTTIVFGVNDIDPTDLLNVIWGYDYNTDTWEELSLTPGPETGSAYTRAAYDPARSRVLVFGGLHIVDGVLAAHDELWTYSHSSGSWEQATSSPQPRVHHDMVLVASSGDLLVFGGGINDSDSGFQGNDLWVYDPAVDTWTALGP